MKVTEIRDEAGLRRLKPEWETLLRDSRSATIFNTWEWAAAWWPVYGKEGRLRILTAHDESGVLRGIAPLTSKEVSRLGQTARALAFVGDGSNDSDYLDFIVAGGYEQQTIEAFLDYLDDDLRGGTMLLLNEVPEDSPALAALRLVSQSRGALWDEVLQECSAAPLPDNWEQYLSTLRPRFRTKVRSALRRLTENVDARFGWCAIQEDIDRLLPALFDLHTRRWEQDGRPGVFGWERKRAFYFALSRELLESGCLRFSYLEWKGRVLACQYGFCYRGVYSQLQEGYEPASEHWSPGIGLRAWSIAELMQEGVRRYDFLGGTGRNKTDWGAEITHSARIAAGRPTSRNLLFCRGPKWAARGREALAQLAPEALLEARRRHLQRKLAPPLAANGGEGAASSAASWIRQTAAGCYFHLGLPSVAQAVVRKYHISDPGDGRRRWARRSGASGRILYYHRVNDEGDSFWPATPTAQFEQEMRFIARHYKVVSLPDLLEGLAEDSPAALVAITFDDGYVDNYLNAFPILQRYGLPATIFLATGSIDSGEPLWFDELAAALQTTARESIDVEIDVPRRLWLRTPTERLGANRDLFAILRVLPDDDRRREVAAILRALGAVGRQTGSPMLNWDQIRHMKANGIAFGGHTVTHPFVSKLTPGKTAWEVSECKHRVEEELQSPVEYFAYPNGRQEDFSEASKKAVREAGYRAALTTIWGLNYRSTDPFEMRRGGPWEGTAAMFASKLDWYQFANV